MFGIQIEFIRKLRKLQETLRAEFKTKSSDLKLIRETIKAFQRIGSASDPILNSSDQANIRALNKSLVEKQFHLRDKVRDVSIKLEVINKLIKAYDTGGRKNTIYLNKGKFEVKVKKNGTYKFQLRSTVVSKIETPTELVETLYRYMPIIG